MLWLYLYQWYIRLEVTRDIMVKFLWDKGKLGFWNKEEVPLRQ